MKAGLKFSSLRCTLQQEDDDLENLLGEKMAEPLRRVSARLLAVLTVSNAQVID